MRGKISSEVTEYIRELIAEVEADKSFGDEIVTIDDQMMTVNQAINLYKSDNLTSRIYGARLSGVK